jgi:hypothetical protein
MTISVTFGTACHEIHVSPLTLEIGDLTLYIWSYFRAIAGNPVLIWRDYPYSSSWSTPITKF